MVFSTLMMGIMQELGLHVTNFDSVVNRFNDELSMKSYVLIDEGVRIDVHGVSSYVVCSFTSVINCLVAHSQMFFGNKGDAEKMKTL